MIASHDPSTPQVTLLYNKRIHSMNNTYFNCPYSTYPPDISDMSLVLLAYPKVIRPIMSRQHLSSLQVQIYPNKSKRTYDNHNFDQPIGLETDLTLAFYRENESFEQSL